MRTAASIVLGALAAALLAAPAAQASFHLIQVREIYPGSIAAPEAEYVELQMFAGGQNHVAGHKLRVYDAAGGLIGTTTFLGDVPEGANQSTILFATPEAEAQFGLLADAGLPGGLSPAGGAACWEDLDCVSWGSFVGALPSPAGTPAGAIPDGVALRRTLTRGCASALDPPDDSDNSAADFFQTAPQPRPNSVPPSEQPCASGGTGGPGGGGPGAGGSAPQTTLKRKPAKRSRDRTPTFRFAADETGARFECKLDGGRYRTCRSPFTPKPLAPGAHAFRVRAVDSSGLADPSPAAWSFRVLRTRG